MRKGLTEIVFILDKSGSMSGLEADTIGGCTALLDAMGGAIHHIGNVYKYAREEDRPEKTIFVITTDGQENASSEYSYEKIQKLVKHQSEKYGWEFIFLGANIDAFSEAERLGIRRDRAVRYECDAAGTAINFSVLSSTICDVRKGKKMKANWSADITEHYNKTNER